MSNEQTIKPTPENTTPDSPDTSADSSVTTTATNTEPQDDSSTATPGNPESTPDTASTAPTDSQLATPTPSSIDTPTSILKEEPLKPTKKKTEIKLDAASLRAAAKKTTQQLLRYAAILFFLLVAGVYGFIILRINLLSSAQPSQSDIEAQTTTTPVPRIDPNVAKRLENLEDNSQNVQTLFDEARKNPFD